MGVVAGQLRPGREPKETYEGRSQPYILLRHLRAGETRKRSAIARDTVRRIDSDASSESEYRISTPASLCSAERNAGDEEISACERGYFAS